MMPAPVSDMRIEPSGDNVPDSFLVESVGTIWQDILQNLSTSLGSSEVQYWIGKLTPCEFRDGTLVLASPNKFILNHVQAHHSSTIKQSWLARCPEVHDVQLVTRASDAGPHVLPLNVGGTNAPGTRLGSGGQNPVLQTLLLGGPLRPNFRFTFANFVVGSENKLAHSVSEALATVEPPPFNPIYIQAGIGMGKTHLLHAILQAYQASAGEHQRIAHWSEAQQFAQLFVQALRVSQERAVEFKEQMRNLDLLLIDDIATLPKNENIQKELLHAISHLLDNGKRVVVAGHNPPDQLNNLEARLRSRLTSGVVASIRPPGAELRHAMVNQLAEVSRTEHPGIVWPPELIRYLADRIASSPRDLAAAVRRLEAEALLVDVPLSVGLAEDRLADLLRTGRGALTPDMILQCVATHYGIREEQLISKTRRAHIVRPRHVAMFLMRELTQGTLCSIGQHFGRDHATVMHAVRTIESHRNSDADLDHQLRALTRELEER